MSASEPAMVVKRWMVTYWYWTPAVKLVHWRYVSNDMTRLTFCAHITLVVSLAKLGSVCSQMVRLRPICTLAKLSVYGHSDTPAAGDWITPGVSM